jgi:hypothetical protein
MSPVGHRLLAPVDQVGILNALQLQSNILNLHQVKMHLKTFKAADQT